MLTDPKIGDRVVVAPDCDLSEVGIPPLTGRAIRGPVGVVVHVWRGVGAGVQFPGQPAPWALRLRHMEPAPTEAPTPRPECAALRAEVSAAMELFADAGLVGYKVGVPGVPALAPSAARACDEVIALRTRLDILLHALAAITAEVGLPPEGCDPETVCASVARLRAGAANATGGTDNAE